MFGKMIRENGLEKMETIILKCNLFRIYWERSVAFIYSYSSLIYSRVLPAKCLKNTCGRVTF